MNPLLLLSLLAASSPDTLPQVVPLPAIEVSTARAADRSPLAVSRLSRAALRDKNWGQDTPMALASLPGAYAYSDAGNGIGYSYLSLRGFPQRRISVLVNGVPLNDPESHEVYWIDHPDLLASTAEVQVQRGVGSALYGAAALGGSVHLETAPFTEAPGFTASLSGGSFATRRLMLEGNSGALANGWNLYGRYSRIETDGYRDQSWSRLWSYALSARKVAGTHVLKLNVYGGPEETHLAYLGVPRTTLDGGLTGDADRDRRTNPLSYEGERDHFFEPHYEAIHTWAPRAGLTLTSTAFWFDGRGYYDERRLGRSLADYRLPAIATFDTALYARDYYALNDSGYFVRDGQGRASLERFDLVRRREVTNRHTGWLPRARIEHAHGALTVGGELRWHDGRHVGTVQAGDPIPPGSASPSRYYDYRPRTLATGLYVREEWDPSDALRVTADLAWRHQSYSMRDDRFDAISFDQRYDFALPKLGITWTPHAALSAYASYALANREPAFRDLYDAEGVGSVPLYRTVNVAAGIYEDPLVRPERVRDLELGASWRGATANVTVNAFRMDFRDELVYAGQFDTDLGYPILGNAARSLHQGLELAVDAARALRGGASLRLDANTSLADHHFVRFREQYGPTPADEVSYDGRALGFFPAVMANVGLALAWRDASVRADAQHAGRIFVDNSETAANSIDPRTVLNLTATLSRVVMSTRATASLRVLNATDVRYETGGYMDYDALGALVPTLTPAATRNWPAEVRMEW